MNIYIINLIFTALVIAMTWMVFEKIIEKKSLKISKTAKALNLALISLASDQTLIFLRKFFVYVKEPDYISGIVLNYLSYILFLILTCFISSMILALLFYALSWFVKNLLDELAVRRVKKINQTST